MVQQVKSEGRSGTDARLWALLSTMPTRAITTSIRCSQTVCSGSIVRPRPARLVSANRGHPNPTKPWPARDTLTALARRATTTLAHQPCMLRSRTRSVMAHSLPLHRVSRHPRGVSSGTRGSSLWRKALDGLTSAALLFSVSPTRLSIKPTPIPAVPDNGVCQR
ncbi:hypothetical protein BKA70DRAFT_115721 [Coprinopsis sp. MPI-PUGE-AT-0042]|nr:hypothetical protein BKA70DRAFT_115721 [Coprinopsis sp. MPI-PUGE-AT-0042]